MLSDAHIALLSSLWQGMATFYGIIFVVYTVQLNQWMSLETSERLDLARRYIRPFKAVLLIGLLTLVAVVVCWLGLIGDNETIVIPASILSGAAITAMFGFLLYEVVNSAAGAALAAIFGDVRSNDPERKEKALKHFFSIDEKTGKKTPAKDVQIILPTDPDAADDGE